MTAATTATPTLTPAPSLRHRLYGLGSIFGKAVRDSRRATIVAAALLAVVFLGVTRAIVTEFDSTTVVLPSYSATVDVNFNLLINPND